MHVVWFDEQQAATGESIGAKGESLARLHRAGFRVPPGFVVTRQAFERSMERHQVRARLVTLFATAGRAGPAELAAAAGAARNAILDNGPDPEVEAAVRAAYRTLAERCGDPSLPVAVRSSASDEDLAEASLAGQQDSFLWVRGEDDVVNRVVHCWASLFAERAVHYRVGRGLDAGAAAMAVVVQQMVLPSAAGVAMTLDPRNGDRTKVVIDSAFGLGEAVVSGEVTPDHFVVDKVMLEIVRRTISHKERECVVADDLVGMKVLGPERADLPSLSDGDVVRLARMARRVEAHFGCPQDVEWALVPHRSGPASLYVLQSRPETVWAGGAPDDRAEGAGTVLDGVVDALTRPATGTAGGAGFPSPLEIGCPPGAEGWETMYPASLCFGGDGLDEDAAFWFRDGIHWPRAIAPFDVTVLQFALTSLSQFNSRYFVVPAALGVRYRVLNGYCYLSPVPVEDEAVVERRIEEFRARAGHYYEHWDELYGAWMRKITGTIGRLEGVGFEPLHELVSPDDVRSGRGTGPVLTLLRSFHELIDLCLELWQYHFEFLNLGYAAYLEFFGHCKQVFPDIPDLAVARMVAGIEVDLFRPDQELRRLARAAVDQGLAGLVCDGTVEDALARVRESDAAHAWWTDYTGVHDPWFNYSAGSGMYHDDPVWADRPDIPFGFVRGYVAQLLRGEEIDTPLEAISAERDRITEEYAGALQGSRREQFLAKLGLARTVYHYVENHNFYVEHWGLSVFWRKVRELSGCFVEAGVWADEDSIFMLRREEVDEAIWDLVTDWATGADGRVSTRWGPEIERRRRVLAACATWTPPPVLGAPPASVNEPFTIMLWGITSESVRGILRGPSEGGDLTGFGASPGVAVGPARVVRVADEIADVRPGEVLVTTLTAPSWAPVFRRVAATVTDTGGIMSHAAIVCREYGLPAVTGTVFATQVIRTGDLVRVDGHEGRVTLLASAPAAGSTSEAC